MIHGTFSSSPMHGADFMLVFGQRDNFTRRVRSTFNEELISVIGTIMTWALYANNIVSTSIKHP